MCVIKDEVFNQNNSNAMLNELLSNGWYLIFLHFIFMSASVLVVIFGISNGIEKVSKILMPALFFILIALFIYTLFLPGNEQAFKFMFYPKINDLKPHTLVEALGHAFFTLSLGIGTMMTYGSYLGKQEKLLKAGIIIIILDTLIALIAGVVIFSLVFTYNMEVGSGPVLIFSTLPSMFGKMFAGNIMAFLFFILLGFAALTSAISIFEVIVTFCIETFKWTRRFSSILVGVLSFFTGVFCALSFNTLSHFKIPMNYIFNAELTFFDLFDKISSNILMPLSGLLISVYAGWKMDSKVFKKELNTKEKKYLPSLIFLLKYVVPIAITFIFLYGLNFMHPVFKFIGLINN